MFPRNLVRAGAQILTFLGAQTLALPAFAEPTAQDVPTTDETVAPWDYDHLQYGAGVAAETVSSAGTICPTDASTPCILNSGGGLAIRVGYRSADSWSLGGVYQFSRHDASNLLVLPILQQVRLEGRYFLEWGSRSVPYVQTGVGLALYGSEWRAETAGPLGTLGGGVEYEVTPELALGFGLGYRALLLAGWEDGAGQQRGGGSGEFGLAHIVALEFTIELRNPLPRL